MNHLKRKSLLITLGLGGTTVLYVLALFMPQMKALAATRDQLRTKQEFIFQAAKLRPVVDSLEEDLKDTASYIETWNAQTRASSELAILYGRISELAKEAGTTTTRFEPQPAVHYKTLERAPVVLSVTGPFAAIEKLVGSLESLDEAVWIEDLRLESPRKDGGNATCELNLAIFADRNDKSD